MDFSPQCEIDCKFLATDAISALAIKGATFILFQKELCVRFDTDGVILTLVTADEGELFLSFFLVSAHLWLVSDLGKIIALHSETAEVVLCENTRRAVHRASSSRNGLAIVFGSKKNEVVAVERGDDNTLAVTQVLRHSCDVTAMAFLGDHSVICGDRAVTVRSGMAERTVDLRNVTCCHFGGTRAWIGTSNGDIYTVTIDHGVTELIPMHDAYVLSFSCMTADQIWSWDSNGKAVSWGADLKPLGSFSLAANLESLNVGPNYTQTPLCGVTQGEVVRWQLNSPPPKVGDSKLLHHLCDLLNVCDKSDFDKLSSKTLDSFLPLAVQHSATPYLIEAVQGLTSTRLLLSEFYTSMGEDCSNLYDDVSNLIERAKRLHHIQNDSLQWANQISKLYKISVPTEEAGGHDLLLHLVRVLCERQQEATELEPLADRSTYVFERRIADLEREVTKKDERIDRLMSELRELREDVHNFQTAADKNEDTIAFQRKSIEELQIQLTQVEDRSPSLVAELAAKNDLLKEIIKSNAEQEEESSKIRSQLERELEDLTQNEVTLLSRIRAYQVKTAESKRLLKDCLKALQANTHYAQLTSQIRLLVSPEKFTVDSIHSF